MTRPTTVVRLVVPLLFAAFTAFHAAGADALSPFFQPGRLRALILSGRNNHDWRTTTPLLRRLLVESGRFDVRVAEAVDGLGADTLAPYDVLIMDYGGPRWGSATERAVEDFVRAGGGFVAIHGAPYHFSGLAVLTDGHRAVPGTEAPWPAFRRMVGCGWDAPPTKGFHGPRHSFDVKSLSPAHPILEGMPPTFRATDELYHGMIVLPEAQVLASAWDDPERGGTGRDEPMLVVTRFGEGRGFYTALGHETPAMAEPGFRTTFLRGTEWAATGKVTLPPDAGQGSKPVPGAVRALVVTGGHEYDPSFYTVFQDRAGFVWRHAASQRDAFRADLRTSTDVVVLYDLSSDLDAAGRQRLREYLEAGGGLVVLHHALADFQDWEWWSKEVVGARYVLQSKPGHAASTYRHGQWMEIVPAVGHPVVDGVGPMRFFDESYHGVWQSPDIRPLLRTSNETSDPVVGWIGPWSRSRVVCLQPGHGPETHLHPAFVQLVSNAIRWAGTREGK